MLDMLNSLADSIYYGGIAPFFSFIARIMNLIFIQPLVALHVPLWLHLCLLAVLTALLSFWLRKLLKTEEKTNEFNKVFMEKRRRQKDLQLIPEKYSRQALYRVTDDELNEMYNSFIAHHYARYVMIYLLPVFLIMAWLNSVFSHDALVRRLGVPYVVGVPANGFGIEGISVTGVFLLAYVTSLITGFRIKRFFGCRENSGPEPDSK